MESEYIIVYDENGEPHLEHAWLRRGQAHKYIMKIGEGLKAKYFYTQAEVDAYMNRGKQKAQNAASQVKGAAEKAGSQVRASGQYAKEGVNAYKKWDKNRTKENFDAVTNNKVANGIRNAKNLGGVRNDLAIRKAAKNATEEYRKNPNEETGNRSAKANRAYQNTRIGKLESRVDDALETPRNTVDAARQTVKEKSNNAKSAAKRLNENTKSKMDKMREEFRKDAESVKDTASKAVSEVKAKSFDKKAEKLQNKADDLNKKAFNDTSKQKDAAQAQIDANNAKIKSLEEDAKASEHKTNKAAIDKLKAQNDDLKDVANGNEIREQSVAENEIKEEKVRDSALKSKYGEYTKGDPDFDDKNFDEKNRAGDSDFFIASRPDGSSVILEEDMKWVLPKGVNPHDPAIVSALNKDFKAGSNEEWVKQVTEAIDEAVEKERSKYPDPNKMRKSSSKESKSEKQSVQKAHKIDPSKVSMEYIYSSAYNSGIKVKPLMNAEEQLIKARRAYDDAENTTERVAAIRNREKAQKKYDELLEEVLSELDKKE